MRLERGSPPGPCAGDIWPAINAHKEEVTHPTPKGSAEEPQAGNNWLPGDPLSNLANQKGG